MTAGHHALTLAAAARPRVLPTPEPERPEVLKRLLGSAAAVARTAHAFLFTVEPGDAGLALSAGVGAFAGSRATLQPGRGIAGRAWASGQALAVADCRAWPDPEPFLSGAGARAVLCVPLPGGQGGLPGGQGGPGGILGVARLTPEPFTPEEARLLAESGTLAGLTLDALGLAGTARARLAALEAQDDRLRDELREANLLTRVVAAATASLDPTRVLESICQEVARAFGVQQAGFALLAGGGSCLRVTAEWIEPGLDAASSLGREIPILGNPSTQEALRTLRPVAVEDARRDPRVETVLDLLLPRGIHSILIVPMVVRGEAIGTLGIDFPTVHEFTPAELSLAQRCANVAAQAVENARLHAAVQSELRERERTERNLRTAEERGRMLLDAIPDVLLRVSSAGVFLDAKAPPGVDVSGLPGKRFEDVLPPDLAAMLRENFKQAIEGQVVRTVECVLKGRHFEVRMAASATGDAVVLVRDVSEALRSQRALVDSIARFENLVNSLDSIVWEADPVTMANTFVSRQAETLLGYDVRDWCDQPNFWERHVHPDDRAAAVRDLEKLLRRGSGRLVSEYRMVARGGQEVWFRDATGLIGEGRDARLLGVMVDITDRKRAERLQEDTSATLEMIARGEDLPDTLLSVARTVERHCPGVKVMVLLSGDSGLRPAWGPATLAGEATAGAAGQAAERALETLAPVVTPLDGRAAGFGACWCLPVVSGQGRGLGVLAALSVLPGEPSALERDTLQRAARLAAMAVEHSHLAARLAYEAGHDALTGLPNRTFFQERLRQMLGLADRQGTQCALFFVDLDRFKHINDTLGHSTGDVVLQQVASRLSGIIRSSDLLARLGGDEFTLAAANLDERGAARLAEKVLHAFVRPFTVGSSELYLTASLGIALAPQDGRDVDTLQRKADVAMYRAKGRGKNAFEFYRPDMNESALERLELENDLRRGLERGEFELHFQPEVALCGPRAGQVASVEALVRWRHPQKGLLAPGLFIPIAEETGLIVRLGAWILGEACRVAATWRGTPLAGARVAVNVAALQFARTDLRFAVQEALRAAGLGAESLELELSESTVMADVQGSARTLADLRELGVHVAVDDFGTGYSSLRYLQRLPLDTLKLEGSFVKDMLGGGTLPLVQAVLALGRSLNLQVVAEWVETREQAEALAALGCDLAQGYHFARPLPPGDLLAWALRPPGNG